MFSIARSKIAVFQFRSSSLPVFYIKWDKSFQSISCLHNCDLQCTFTKPLPIFSVLFQGSVFVGFWIGFFWLVGLLLDFVFPLKLEGTSELLQLLHFWKDNCKVYSKTCHCQRAGNSNYWDRKDEEWNV